MSKQTEALKLAQDLRALADRFSEGWHDGIKIDALDIELLSNAAEALAEQPAQQEPVAFSCLRCVTPKKCAIYGCSPNTWPSETPPASKPWADEQKDAARYRHIKTMAGALSVRIDGNHVWRMNLVGIFGPNLDEAIDRSIEAKLKEKNA